MVPLRKIFPHFSSRVARMLRFALNSLESVRKSIIMYIYYLIGHAKLILCQLWYLRHFFEERLRRDKYNFPPLKTKSNRKSKKNRSLKQKYIAGSMMVFKKKVDRNRGC